MQPFVRALAELPGWAAWSLVAAGALAFAGGRFSFRPTAALFSWLAGLALGLAWGPAAGLHAGVGGALGGGATFAAGAVSAAAATALTGAAVFGWLGFALGGMVGLDGPWAALGGAVAGAVLALWNDEQLRVYLGALAGAAALGAGAVALTASTEAGGWLLEYPAIAVGAAALLGVIAVAAQHERELRARERTEQRARAREEARKSEAAEEQKRRWARFLAP